MMRRISRLAILGIAGLAVGGVLTSTPIAAAGTVGFGKPIFVDTVRAGGEPGIIHSNKFGNLVYTAHEGTTHLDREGGPASIQQFLCPGLTTADCYKNHVWIWTSDDRGQTWQLRDEALPYPAFTARNQPAGQCPRRLQWRWRNLEAAGDRIPDHCLLAFRRSGADLDGQRAKHLFRLGHE